MLFRSSTCSDVQASTFEGQGQGHSRLASCRSACLISSLAQKGELGAPGDQGPAGMEGQGGESGKPGLKGVPGAKGNTGMMATESS